MYTIYGFYKFKKIKFLKKYQLLFQKEISNNNIKGTIILSSEGINGTISAKKNNINKIVNLLKRQLKFKDFDTIKTEPNKMIQSCVNPRMMAFFKLASNTID